jgi:hypothetical protein
VILAKILSAGKVLNLWLLGRGTAKCWLCPKHSRHSRIQVKLQILVFMVNTRRSGSFHASIYTLTTWVAEGALTQLARHEGDGRFSQLSWWLHTEGVAARYNASLPLRLRRELSLNNIQSLTFTFISVSDFEGLCLFVHSALGQHFRRNVHNYLRKDLHIIILFIFWYYLLHFANDQP